VCTSIETWSRSSWLAAAYGDAAAPAAGVSDRVPAQPANIAEAVVSSVLHIQSRRFQA
jgi:hypothetical protein